MKFYFDRKNWAVGTLCDNKGCSCIIGQFLVQECCWDTRLLKSQDTIAKPYDIFGRLTGIPPEIVNTLHEINDNLELTENQKIKMFRGIFKNSNYKFIVRK